MASMQDLICRCQAMKTQNASDTGTVVFGEENNDTNHKLQLREKL